jgi:ribonucleoside-diphosphate reductase alpha chain
VFEDYAYRMGVSGRTANEITGKEYLEVLALAANYVDSAVSKTYNIGDDVPYEDFKSLYYDAWKLGCKGITTFRATGNRYGILDKPKEDEEPQAEACYFDAETGQKTCD